MSAFHAVAGRGPSEARKSASVIACSQCHASCARSTRKAAATSMTPAATRRRIMPPPVPTAAAPPTTRSRSATRSRARRTPRARPRTCRSAPAALSPARRSEASPPGRSLHLRAAAGRSRRSRRRLERHDLERDLAVLECEHSIGQARQIGWIVRKVADQHHRRTLRVLFVEHPQCEEQPIRDLRPGREPLVPWSPCVLRLGLVHLAVGGAKKRNSGFSSAAAVPREASYATSENSTSPSRLWVAAIVARVCSMRKYVLGLTLEETSSTTMPVVSAGRNFRPGVRGATRNAATVAASTSKASVKRTMRARRAAPSNEARSASRRA